jgi:aryl-alcohol dehydrogenase-like predicted oxidoreductase
VSELALGTMTFGDDWGWGAPPEEARRQYERFREAGGNFVDTANNYTNGSAEKIVGALVASERGAIVLASKYTIAWRPGDPNAAGNHRKNMVQSVEASLKRLGTDYLDLLWLHAWDDTVPPAEVMRALDDLVRAGKVLHVGVSDTPAWVVAHANTLALLRGWSPFVALQIEYSLLQRTVERELTPMAQAFQLPVCAWGALGGGVLTGKYTRGGTPDAKRDTSARRSERNLAIARTVDAVADKLGTSSTRVAIAWLRQQPGTVIPIVGARTVAQLDDALGAVTLTLPAEALAELDAVSAVELGFPHQFLQQSYVRKLVGGDTLDRLMLDPQRPRL